MSLFFRDVHYAEDLWLIFEAHEIPSEIDGDHRIGANQYAWNEFDRVIQYEWLRRIVNPSRIREVYQYGEVKYLDGAFKWNLTPEGSNYWRDMYHRRIAVDQPVIERLKKMEETYNDFREGNFDPFS